METICSLKMLVPEDRSSIFLQTVGNTHYTILCHNLENHNLSLHGHRNLSLIHANFFIYRILATKAASIHEMSRGQRWLTGSKETPGWGEYFGLKQATITNTITHYETASYTDPQAVVTFSVVGCQPSRLPFDLPYCKTSTPNITGQ